MSSSDFSSFSDSSDSDSSSSEVITFRTKGKDKPAKPQPKATKDSKDKKEPAKKSKTGAKKYDFSDSDSDSSSSSSDDIFGSNSYSDKSSTSSSESSSRDKKKDKPDDTIKKLQKAYDKNELDIPPWKDDGPQVLIIIDTNLDSPEYKEYFARIKRNNTEVDSGKRPKKDFVMCFAMSEVENIYDFCLKNIDVLRTYNGHPDRIRFLTNSNRASACVGRQADPKKAGNSFVRYVRDELELRDAPILVYYFSNTSCLALRDEAHNVFCTNESQIAEPYIVFGKLPK